jgi:NADH:ubiquinone oxidoreductase subunit 5 (subunit L)/multisubunit Na+/H+ antiporter MnhA subunit
MSETPLLWLIPGLPLLGAVVAGFFGPRLLRDRSHWPVVLACAGACAVTLWALFRLLGMEHHERHLISARR